KTLLAFGAQSAENKRIAGEDLLSAQNSYKAYTGFLAGLRDPQLMGRKRDEEQTLRSKVEKDAEMRAKYGSAWDDIAAAYRKFRPDSKEYALTTPYFSDLFTLARNVLRLPEEMQKPSDQRLREYRDSALPSLEQQMYSTAPIHDSLEIAMLGDYFRFMKE